MKDFFFLHTTSSFFHQKKERRVMRLFLDKKKKTVYTEIPPKMLPKKSVYAVKLACVFSKVGLSHVFQ